jgi:hypothetical protein
VIPKPPSQEERQEISGSVKDIAKNINIPIMPMMGMQSRTQMLLDKKKIEEEERARRQEQELEEYEQRKAEAKRIAEEQAAAALM